MRHYYLSKFEWFDGRYRPSVAQIASKWAILDFRRDERRQAGWCIVACDGLSLPTQIEFGLLADLDFVPICASIDDELSDETRDRLSIALDLPFSERTLRSIIVELQLCYSNIRPDTDGNYKIFLREQIWSATEEEAFCLLANYVFPFHEQFRAPQPGTITNLDPARLTQQVDLITHFLNVKSPNWLASARKKQGWQSHPLVSAIDEVCSLTPSDLSRSHKYIWFGRLANDIEHLSEHVAPNIQMCSRLRDADDCESLIFELFVMSAYCRHGCSLTLTDNNPKKSAECVVDWNGVSVHLECKRKSTRSVRPRAARKAFERIRDQVFRVMDDLGRNETLLVHSRYDPTENDLQRIEGIARQLLASSRPTSVRDGKLEVELLGTPVLPTPTGPGFQVPRGCDFVEAIAPNDDFSQAKCFAWKTRNRWGWLRSGVAELKKAATQLPRDEPSVVFLQVPKGPPHVVWLRIQALREEIVQLLTHDHARISAVVVTGDSEWMKCFESSDIAACVTTIYEFVENVQTRNPLPKDFPILGRDFRASYRRPNSSLGW